MIIVPLLATALAAPPQGVDPDDLDRWEPLANAAMEGPAGCWKLTGTLRYRLRLYTPGTMWTRAGDVEKEGGGTFSGTLHDGVWTELDTVFPPADPDDIIELDGEDLHPLVGTTRDEMKRDGASPGGAEQTSKQAVGMMTRLMDAFDATTAISVAQWRDDPAGIELIQDIPLGSSGREVVQIKSFLPDGDDHVSRLDLLLPRKVKVGERPFRVTVMDGQVHLRQHRITTPTGQALSVPAAESFSAGAAILGFTVGFEQDVVYTTVSPCQ